MIGHFLQMKGFMLLLFELLEISVVEPEPEP
jgi:hypothetical protein